MNLKVFHRLSLQSHSHVFCPTASGLRQGKKRSNTHAQHTSLPSSVFLGFSAVTNYRDLSLYFCNIQKLIEMRFLVCACEFTWLPFCQNDTRVRCACFAFTTYSFPAFCFVSTIHCFFSLPLLNSASLLVTQLHTASLVCFLLFKIIKKIIFSSIGCNYLYRRFMFLVSFSPIRVFHFFFFFYAFGSGSPPAAQWVWFCPGVPIRELICSCFFL